MNKNSLIKIVLTLIAITGLIIVTNLMNQHGGSSADGTITFIVIDENGDKVIDDEIEYESKKDDGTQTTFFDVLQENYDLVCMNASTKEPDPSCGKESEIIDKITGVNLGKVILSVDDINTDFRNRYFAVYKNEDYAAKGVSQLTFEDGDVIEFKVVNR